MQRLRKIAEKLEQTGGSWGLDDIVKLFVPCIDTESSVFNFIHEQIMRKNSWARYVVARLTRLR